MDVQIDITTRPVTCDRQWRGNYLTLVHSSCDVYCPVTVLITNEMILNREDVFENKIPWPLLYYYSCCCCSCRCCCFAVVVYSVVPNNLFPPDLKSKLLSQVLRFSTCVGWQPYVWSATKFHKLSDTVPDPSGPAFNISLG